LAIIANHQPGERLVVGLEAVFATHTIAISLPELHRLRRFLFLSAA